MSYRLCYAAWPANSGDLDEVAHNDPSHLDLHYLPFKSLNSKYDKAWTLLLFFFENLQTKILSSISY